MDIILPDKPFFRKFKEVIVSYPNNLKDYSGERPSIGFFTPRIPVELLHSLGANPIRVIPSQINQTSTSKSDTFVQGFCCSWLRSILDQQLEGIFDFIDFLIFCANTCDSLLNMSDIWRHAFPNQEVYNFTHPIKTDEDLAKKYFTTELNKLIEILLTKFPALKFDETKLKESINLYNTKRSILLEAMDLVSHSQASYLEFFITNLVGDILPIEQYLPLLKQSLSYWKELSPSSESPNSRLILSGGMFDNFQFIQALDPLKGIVVADDLSFGSRNLFSVSLTSNNLLESIASAYLGKVPESAQFDPANKRSAHLLNLVNKHQADGVIYVHQKFCDPDAFESVAIKEFLQEKEIPLLILELDPELSNIEQITTRIEAFIEILNS
ncbi:MAG: 2-hydroxyacyl-CoA dehydratase subunit D [Promethearchaeota archaeon]